MILYISVPRYFTNCRLWVAIFTMTVSDDISIIHQFNTLPKKQCILSLSLKSSTGINKGSNVLRVQT